MIDVICLKGFAFKPFVGEGLRALMASADVLVRVVKGSRKAIFYCYEIFHCFYCQCRFRIDDSKSDKFNKWTVLLSTSTLLHLPVRDKATRVLKYNKNQTVSMI